MGRVRSSPRPGPPLWRGADSFFGAAPAIIIARALRARAHDACQPGLLLAGCIVQHLLPFAFYHQSTTVNNHHLGSAASLLAAARRSTTAAAAGKGRAVVTSTPGPARAPSRRVIPRVNPVVATGRHHHLDRRLVLACRGTPTSITVVRHLTSRSGTRPTSGRHIDIVAWRTLSDHLS